MTRFDETEEWISVIFDDLERRACHVLKPPPDCMVVLGKFIEDMHAAVALVLGFIADDVNKGDWVAVLEAKGYTIHKNLFADIVVIYGKRNMGGHSNIGQHTLSHDSVRSYFSLLKGPFRQLAILLPDFVRAFLKCQNSSKPIRYMTTLKETISDMAHEPRVIDCVVEYAKKELAGTRMRFLTAPRDQQIALIFREFARFDEDTTAEITKALAEYVYNRLNSEVDCSRLDGWLREMSALADAPDRMQERFLLLRATIVRDPDVSEGLVLRNFQMLEPSLPRQDFNPSPIPIGSAEKLLEVLRKPIEHMKVAYLKRFKGSDMKTTQFVLQLNVPADLACQSFDVHSKSSARSLWDIFRCVVVRPNDTGRIGATLSRPIHHPDTKGNSIALWDALAVESLREKLSGMDCYFAGPALWVQVEARSVPSAVKAFDNLSVAALIGTQERDTAIELLFDKHRQLPLGKFFDRIKEFRRVEQRCVVLWDDLMYDPDLAETV